MSEIRNSELLSQENVPLEGKDPVRVVLPNTGKSLESAVVSQVPLLLSRFISPCSYSALVGNSKIRQILSSGIGNLLIPMRTLQ